MLTSEKETYMKIRVNDQRKIHAIQEEFNQAFPFLKIEFFTQPHGSTGYSPKHYLNSTGKTLGECRLSHQEGSITITPDMTVDALEQSFQNIYGLSVQVFRKSGKVWLETTVTDYWTLEKQNAQGEELSQP